MKKHKLPKDSFIGGYYINKKLCDYFIASFNIFLLHKNAYCFKILIYAEIYHIKIIFSVLNK